MVAHRTPAFLFNDARELHAAALERVAAGDLRDAADKAWYAIRNAAVALILAHTGQEPRTSGQVNRALRRLRHQSAQWENLYLRYSSAQRVLHGVAFYDGRLDPEDELIIDIRAAADYIRDAAELAQIGERLPGPV